MKKFFSVMMLVLVVLLAFTGCEKFTCSDSHKVSELAGTWTCFQENFAEALVIKSNGSVLSTGYDGEYWEDIKGNISIQDGKIAMIFEDDDNLEGHFDFIPEIAFSVTTEDGKRYTYNYCKDDFSDEIVGMWVCNDATNGTTTQMAINTYMEDGTNVFTGVVPNTDNYMLNVTTKYKVVGDLMFKQRADNQVPDGAVKYIFVRLMYTPNATLHGDIMSHKQYITTKNETSEIVLSFLRINQNLDLAGKKYDYSATYMSNAKGQDKDITFLNTKFNFAKMNGSIIDKFLKSVLYGVQFPNAKTFEYNCLLEGKNVALQLPMEVDGNKITIKMSSRNAAYRDIDVYAFQDEDCSQFHMYMPTSTFENFFGNLSLSILSASGKVDINNPVHVEAVYKEVVDAIESINVSIVMKESK